MKIAICEDEKRDSELLKKYIREIDPELPVRVFSKGSTLDRAFEKEFYDIVLMDIDLGDTDGYDLAVRLRKLDPRPLVIFTTQHVDYAIRGYGIAERYLSKPIAFADFEVAFSAVMRKAEPQKVLLLGQNNKSYVINADETLYFEIFSHNIEFCQSNGRIIKVPTTLKEVVDLFPKQNFVQIHRSYCINLNHIDRIDGKTSVTMTNGKKLSISRSRYDEFEIKLHEFFRNAIL